jgi:hypothetical protein
MQERGWSFIRPRPKCVGSSSPWSQLLVTLDYLFNTLNSLNSPHMTISRQPLIPLLPQVWSMTGPGMTLSKMLTKTPTLNMFTSLMTALSISPQVLARRHTLNLQHSLLHVMRWGRMVQCSRGPLTSSFKRRKRWRKTASILWNRRQMCQQSRTHIHGKPLVGTRGITTAPFLLSSQKHAAQTSTWLLWVQDCWSYNDSDK